MREAEQREQCDGTGRGWRHMLGWHREPQLTAVCVRIDRAVQPSIDRPLTTAN